MPQKTNSNWEELIRAGIYPFNVSLPMHSIRYSNRYLLGPKYRRLFLYLESNTAYYYENFADHERVGKYCLNLFLRKKGLLKRYLKFWTKEFSKLNQFFARARKKDLSKPKTVELADLLLELYEKTITWHGIAYNVDAIDATLNPLFEKLIAKVYPNGKKSKISALQNQLAFPEILSYANRLYLEKLRLFQKISKKGLRKSPKEINNFLNKHYWIDFSWEDSKEYTAEKLIAEYKKIDLQASREEIKEIRKNFRAALRKKAEILAEIAAKKPLIKKYLTIFDAYAILHDWRKEGQVKAVWLTRKIYQELSRRLKIDQEILFYFWPLEMVKICQGRMKLNVALAKKRRAKWFCEYSQSGRSKEYFGKEAEQKRAELISLNEKNEEQEFSGVGASAGRVKGKARVCLNFKDAITWVKVGDILVTGMTMPEFVPAMKKAAAVVTDEGGLTCHAAIICRELSIPCVVGTKIATRMIKDGDLIEVNANHGVVKVIKN